MYTSQYMNIFKNVTFSWWQVSLFKIAMFLLGIAVGTFWSDFFKNYFVIIISLGVVLSVYISYVWFKQ